MSESDDGPSKALGDWFTGLAESEKQANAERRQGRLVAGTEPCPVCGAGLVNDRCLSCNYPTNLLSCPHCGEKYPNGSACQKCGWTKDTPLCRNCNADLIPGHMVRKVLEDDWAWKCCAYCGWPIERYLQRTIIYTPYVKPYESDYNGSGFNFGAIFMSLVSIFIIAMLVPVMLNFNKGFIPVANITSTPVNSTIHGTQTIGTQLGPILSLYPLFFVFLAMIFMAKIFHRQGDF